MVSPTVNIYGGLTDEELEEFAASSTEPGLPTLDYSKGLSDEELEGLMNPEQKSSSWLKDIGKNLLKSTFRTAGIGIGIINAPLAAVWGSQATPHLFPKEYKKMPIWKQALVSMGGGLESAWRSISKKGDWGTMYGDYYKAVKGKTIEEDLPENLKWAAPTLETLANIVSDPLISFGQAARIAQLRVPKGFIGKMPKRMVDDLNRLEKLEIAEKVDLQRRLMNALGGRRDYMRWWKNEGIPEIMRREEATRTTLERMRQYERPYFSREEIVTKPEKIIPEITKRIKEARILGKVPARKQKIVEKFKIEEFAKGKGIPISEVPTEKLKTWKLEKARKGIEAFRKRKQLPPLSTPFSKNIALKATGGVMLGVEENEQGNLSYNPGLGTFAALAFIGGLKVRNTKSMRKVQQTLAKNPAWAKVASQIAEEPNLLDKTSGLWSKINIKLFDRFAPLKKVSPKTYEAARMHNSYKDQAALKMRPLQEAFRPIKKDDAAVTHYILAHRDVTRAERGIANPRGVTLSDAKQAIKEIETDWIAKGKNIKDLRDVRDSFNQWAHDHILYEALENGFSSQAMYDDIVKNNKWYATYDVMDYFPENLDDLPMLPSREYFSVTNQDILKKMKGTVKPIRDPIEATIKKFTKAQALFARNRVASMLIDDPAMKPFLKPVARSKKEFGIMKNKGLDPVMEGSWSKKEFDVINRFKDGKVDRYVVSKEIADTMKQLSPWQAPRAIQMYNSVFRAAATSKNLAFMIGNVARDAFMAYVTVPVYRTRDIFGSFQKDWATGAWEAMKFELGRPSLVEDYVKAGGGFGYAGAEAFERGIGRTLAKQQLFAKTLPKKVATVITGPLDLIEKINNVVELAPRMGTFQRAIKKGYLPKDAALMARQATIDFNRGGTLLKAMNQFVPFLNARVQARVTLADALKRDLKGTVAKGVTATVLPGLAAYAWNKAYYADLYEDIPEYIKQNYYTVIYGKTEDDLGRTVPKYFVIAKGDMGQMAFNSIEFGLEQEYRKDPNKILKFAVNYLSDLSPVEFAREGEMSFTKFVGGILPPAAKAVLEPITNLSFYTGREIVPYWIGKTKPPGLQYKDLTPETYKWLGKKIGRSPLILQNIANNVVAQYGREGLDPSAMLRGLQGRIVKTTGGNIENRAWITIKDIEQGYVKIRADAEEFVKAGDKQAAIRLLNGWNAGLNKQIIEYNKIFREYNLQDKGGLRQSYLFTPIKRRNILLQKIIPGTPLERRLRRGR